MKVINLLILSLLISCTSGKYKPSDPINEQMLKDYPKIYKCYEKSLANKNKQAGSLTVEFTITYDGSTTNTKVVESDFDELDFHKCVEEKVNQIQFLRMHGIDSMDVTKPIPFKPKDK